ncbi:hypothetical protein AB1L30_21050 [Bremerella sp. JC817]|uniref:hypothetical protein n=1 Tax=Bremerella sp. JC817 TaxID=3231756 RepID=UPI003458B27C
MSQPPEANPFTSPHGDNQSPPEMSSMPAGLAMAVLLGMLLTLLQVLEFFVIGYHSTAQQFSLLLGAILTLAISSGLLRHSSTIWAIARYYFLFHGMTATGFCLMAFFYLKPMLAIGSGLIQAAFCVAIFLVLGNSRVRQYHLLECPACHHINSGGDDLLCLQRRCVRCGFRW